MSAVVNAATDIVKGAGDAVGAVIHGAGDLVEGVVDNVVKPVAKVVVNTVQEAIKNPVATALKVAAVASGNPEFLPLINGADALAHGATPEQALASAGASYLSAQVTPTIAPTFDTGYSPLDAVASGATRGAISSAISGGDPFSGAVTGGLNAGVNTALDKGASAINYQLNQPSGDSSVLNYKIPDYVGSDETTPTDTFNLDQIKANAEAGMQPVDYSLKGDVSTPGGIGLNPNTSYSELTMDSIRGLPPGLRTMGGAQGLTVPVEGGTVSAAGFTDKNALPALGDPSSFINDPNVTGQPITPTPSCYYNVDVPNINLANLLSGQRQQNLDMLFGCMCSNIRWLDTRSQYLRGKNLEELVKKSPTGGLSGAESAGIPRPEFVGELDRNRVNPEMVPQFNNITPELASVLAARGYGAPIMAASGGSIGHYADGASVLGTWCSQAGTYSGLTPKFYPAKCGMLPAGTKTKNPLALAALKQMTSHIASGGNMGGMSKGGLPVKYQEAAPHGHNPEFITGVTGYYAGGRGTGQSDDIPAMLHDGDYVIDAEAVSALGDGSSKAGNDALMHFMRQVPHDKEVGHGKPVPAKIADGEVVLPESFVTALGGGDNKRGARMLDEMRERLRQHKRSAPNSKIPPKAKTPLEYLKGVKG